MEEFNPYEHGAILVEEPSKPWDKYEDAPTVDSNFNPYEHGAIPLTDDEIAELKKKEDWRKDYPVVEEDKSFTESAMDMAGNIASQKVREVGQVARGLLGGVGDTANLFPLATGAIDKGVAAVLPEGSIKDEFNKAGDENLSYDIGGKVREWFDEITDNKFKPKDIVDNIVDTASSFLSPAGAIGKGGKVLHKMAKATLPALGAATALETTKGAHFLPEAIPARELIEDVTKSMIGSASPAIAMKALGKLKNIPLKQITKGDVDQKVLNYAKQANIDLPYHVATNNDTAKFLANNMFKSYFISKSWKDLNINADLRMIDKVRGSVDKVSKNIITKEQASDAFRDKATDVFKELKEKANVLYKPAVEAGKKERVNVTKQLDPLRKSLDEIKSKFDPAKMSLDTGGKFLHQKAIDIENTLLKQKTITIADLYNQRSALLKDANYGKAEGSKAWLQGLSSAIDDNIELIANNSKNSEFKKLYKEANSFYKNEYVTRVKTTMSKALVKEEMPKEAYSYMNNVDSIKKLEKIIGVNSKTKPILNDLKRAKLQEILIDKVFDSGGTLSHANLSNLFNKKSTQQGLLKELLGTSNYKSMQRLSTLSGRFIKTGKEYANPSGTSHSSKDKLLAASITGAFGFGIGVKSAGASLLTPYFLSKAMSNKQNTDNLVEIAKKINKGQSVKKEYHLLESTIIGLNNDMEVIE